MLPVIAISTTRLTSSSCVASDFYVDPDVPTVAGLLKAVLLDQASIDVRHLLSALRDSGVAGPTLAREGHFHPRTAPDVCLPDAVGENTQLPFDGPAAHHNLVAADRLAAPKVEQHEVFTYESAHGRPH